MRSAIITVVLLNIFQLLGTRVSLAQAPSESIIDQHTAATPGKGKPAATSTAEDTSDPSRLTYARLYCTADGNSHFDNVTVDLPASNFAPPAAPIHIGGKVPTSTAFFGGFEARWGARDLENHLYHPAPAAQFVVILEGVFSITTTDGETRQFHPGSVIRLEDTAPCREHITVVGDKPGYFMFAR